MLTANDKRQQQQNKEKKNKLCMLTQTKRGTIHLWICAVQPCIETLLLEKQQTDGHINYDIMTPPQNQCDFNTELIFSLSEHFLSTPALPCGEDLYQSQVGNGRNAPAGLPV